MFEDDFIVKLDQALIMYTNWPKLCQHTHFKLLQVKMKLVVFFWVITLYWVGYHAKWMGFYLNVVANLKLSRLASIHP